MGVTKKVGSTGRFGSRYGVGIRKKLLKVETLQIQKQKCPNCGAPAVKRKSRGIFACKKCTHEFVGGAYLPKTLTGGLISQMVSQKRFVPAAIEELSEIKEGTKEEIKEEIKEEKKKVKKTKKKESKEKNEATEKPVEEKKEKIKEKIKEEKEKKKEVKEEVKEKTEKKTDVEGEK